MTGDENEVIKMDEPNIAQKAPYLTDVEAGRTYYWCACGRSKNQPFCDGSHGTTNFRNVVEGKEP